nr:MurR/RpiR family transcriptional regulator [Ruegeria lacuscaerulensis]
MQNMTLNSLTRRLRGTIDQLPPALQAAAKYVLDHPGNIALDPIRVSADKIGVSTNVLVRLSERLGYDSYEAFRSPFRHALLTDRERHLNQSWLAEMHEGTPADQAQAKFAETTLNVTTRSLRLMTPEKTAQALDVITSSRRCFVTATRASYALSYYFSYVGRMAHPGIQLIPRHVGAASDDLVDATQQDCLLAITVHPYSADTIQSMRSALARRMRLILITDSEVVAPGIQPDVLFPVSTRSLHHFSAYSGAMAVLECLLGQLFDAGGADALNQVQAYEKAREQNGAYWAPSKTPRIRR